VTGRHHGWKVLGSTDPIDTDRQQRTNADRDGHEWRHDIAHRMLAGTERMVCGAPPRASWM
jgi:hypothetical protein